MNHNNFDMYYDNPPNRSPNSQRGLNRQASRSQFEPTAYLPSNLYSEMDPMRSSYGGDRYGEMRNATVGGYGGGYDMGGQSWNAGAFGHNNTMGGPGGPGSRKPPSRGRAGIPSVGVASYVPNLRATY